MTRVSTPTGTKNSIVESSAAIRNAPHQVRKNEKKDWKMPPKGYAAPVSRMARVGDGTSTRPLHVARASASSS